MTHRMLNVFISYAREDRDIVDPYFDKLSDAGFSPWMDHRSLLPGVEWTQEIPRAFARCEVTILFLSPRSIGKTGYVQREGRDAIERLRYAVDGHITVIPVILEPCDIPPPIGERLQAVSIQTPGAWEAVLASLRLAANQRQIAQDVGVEAGPFHVVSQVLEDGAEGFLGYDLRIEYPHFTSSLHRRVAEELTAICSGYAHAQLSRSRPISWSDAERAEREHWLHPSEYHRETVSVAYASETVVSLKSEAHTFGIGAAHGNTHYRTWLFDSVQGLRQVALLELFDDPVVAVQRVSELCIHALERDMWLRVGRRDDDRHWLETGAAPKWENFASFTLDGEGITFWFPPYQVASYAVGPFNARVAYFDLLDVLKPEGLFSRAVRHWE
ncbi:MAG: TIR domain-containing protein [Luteibacter sp.]